MSNPITTNGTTIVTNEMMSNPPVRSPVRMIESRIPKIDSIESMPKSGVSAKAAKKVVYRDLKGDSNPQANLASFVCTEMEQEAEEILLDGMKKNFIDLEQYPGSGLVEKKCIQIIGGLWNAPAAVKARTNARTETNSGANLDNTNSGATICSTETNLDTRNLTTDTKVVGTSCLGSSEAIMLAGLAMRSKWRTRREKEGKDIAKPNMVFGSNVQVCWHKMCRYFDIECREANVYGNIDSPEDSKLILTAEQIKFENLIDENTIGVCPILGSTYNGEYEDVKGIHDMVVEINEKTGWDIPLHIDAASGGFIAPFLEPELVWDFRLPNVKSINASGHKFGLTYAGLGWLLFREEKDLPKDLCFSVSYLGGNQESFTLNFSKPASAILAQYYNFIRLGFEGYKEVMSESMSTANYLRQALKKLHCPIADSTSTTTRSDESTSSTPRMMSDDSTSAVSTGNTSPASTIDSVSRKNIPRVHIVDKQHMPLVSWSLSKEQQKYCTVFELSDRLQKKGGWSVPAYSCSAGAEGLDIMRVVVKNSFSMVMCDLLVKDILDSFQFFDERYQKRQMMESQSMESNILTHMSTINEDQIYLPASAENTITAEILKKFNKDSKKKMQVSGSKSGVDSLFSDSINNETTENETMDTMDAIEKMDTPVKSSSSSSSKAVTETTINVVQNKMTISNAAEQGLAMFMSMLALFFAMLSSFFMWSSNMTTLIKEYCEEHSGVKTEKSTLERKSSESKKTFRKNLIADKEVLVDDDSEDNSTIDDNESDKKHTEEEQSTAIAKVREAKKPSLDFQAREISTSRRNPCNPTKKLSSPRRLGSIKKISSSSSSRALSSRALSTTVSTTASSSELLNSSNHNLLDDSDEDFLDSAHTFAYLASQRNIILPTN